MTAIGPRYSVKYRRRRKGKTDYKKRLDLLKSRKSRIVVRRTNNYISIQLIDYKDDGDIILASASSRELKKYGWKHNTKNLPAAYLTGLLFGNKVKKLKVKEAVLDLSRYTRLKGTRIYSAVKGVSDSRALNFSCSDDVFPDEKRLKGEHIQKEIASEFEKVKNKIAK